MGESLLFAQIGLLIFLFFFSNLFDLFSNAYLILIFFLGLVTIISGYLSIGFASYSPFVKLRRHNALSRRGAYKYVRHPIYTGLMLIGLAFLLSRFTLLVTVLYVLFVWATNTKANLEEQLLTKRHPKYKNYKRQVKKYIPFVF
jgi:protein-S-isoprenylcysteine O-methyltransferase Ste14